MKDPPQKLLEHHFRPHHRPFLAAFVSDWIAWTTMGRRDRDDDDDEEEEEEAIEPAKGTGEEGVEDEEEEEVPDDDPGVVANVTRLVFENMPKDMRYSHVQKTMRL